MNSHTIRTSSESGFSLLELMVSTVIALIVIGTALTAFMNGVEINDIATQVGDASQNLRSGVNLLQRDLMQTGRGIPTGGISIPLASGGATAIHRPPSNFAYFFDNTTSTTLTAVTTGAGKGPTIKGRTTDIVTLLMIDSILDECLPTGALQVNPSTATGAVPKLAADGSSFNVGPSTAWIAGDPVNAREPVKPGDLVLFTNPGGSTAIQTVTRVDASNVYFDAADPKDAFNFNQRGVTAGSITQLLGTQLTVQRVLMYTYYVDPASTTAPRLMRAANFSTGQALAGVIEDLELSYDLVDGVTNPTNVADLPYTAAGVTYSANLIRKANLHIGVRSETMSTKQRDYLRNHLTTVVSLRNLAFVDRYR